MIFLVVVVLYVITYKQEKTKNSRHSKFTGGHFFNYRLPTVVAAVIILCYFLPSPGNHGNFGRLIGFKCFWKVSKFFYVFEEFYVKIRCGSDFLRKVSNVLKTSVKIKCKILEIEN